MLVHMWKTTTTKSNNGGLFFQDVKRLKAHELLETETIKASALRHRLTNFPHKLKAELTG